MPSEAPASVALRWPWLRSQGHDARNMTGGMTSWAAAGLPVVDDAGLPGTVV